MSALIIFTWHVNPELEDEFWDFTKGEEAILEHYGAKPIRYFHNLGDLWENIGPNDNSASESVVVSVVYEYESAEAWRTGYQAMQADPDYQAHVARWTARRGELLMAESSGVLLSEVDIETVASEKRA